MSDMDEISFWVYTKQAPCLYNYDNLIKRQLAEAQRAARPASSPSDVQEVIVTPKKKTKRKLSLLGDESASPEKKNVYFETSQNNQRTVLSSYKTETDDSDSDFNIKKSSVKVKAKRIKLQRNRTLHKKNKVVTSTPKPEATLRRSTRRQQLNDTFNSSLNITSTHNKSTNISKHEPKKTPQRIKRGRNHVEKNANGDHNTKSNSALNKTQKNGVIHRPFDDLSDVSGLTANYIRSTKVQTTQSSRNLRSKNNKSHRDTGQMLDKGDGQINNVCINKSVNTSKPKAAVNYSTDSSQNILNLVTTKPIEKYRKVNKGTSLLKFVDARSPKKDNNTTRDTSELNLSFHCQRRPSKGHKMSTEVTETVTPPTESTDMCNKRLRGKNCNNLNDRKENPDDSLVSRTRSGRSIGLRQLENSVLVFNNSTEQISSGLTVNVATCANNTQQSRSRDRQKKRLSPFKRLSEQRSTDCSDLALRRNVTRERSGFAACFSDSDQEAEAVKPRKFFC